MLDQHETVDAWTSAGLNLNPRQLIPALMRYYSERRPRDEPSAAIRYLEYCVVRQQSDDNAVHNLLLSLYARCNAIFIKLRVFIENEIFCLEYMVLDIHNDMQNGIQLFY